MSETERERVGEVYARYATSPRKRRDWSAENPGNAAIRSELVASVFELAGDALRDAERILDIGCGSGWWLGCLAEDPRVSASLHGLELLPERAAAAAERVPSARIAVGDARQLDYEDGRFQVVTQFTVLSSLGSRTDVHRALGEARRVLAPGGSLLVWEPRLPNPLNRGTLTVSASMIRRGLGSAPTSVRSTTVLPPLARRLGRHTDSLYPRLAAIPMLHSHRLVLLRA